MEAKAKLRYIRMAPRKLRVVLDQIRDEDVDTALARLRLTNRRAASVVYKLLASAVANANAQYGASTDDLYVSKAFADEGPTLRRFRPRAMGRATRINKRTSHVTVVVAERD